jgi:hypothetical protein
MKRAFKEIVQNAANEYAKQKEDEIRSSENQMVLQLFYFI